MTTSFSPHILFFFETAAGLGHMRRTSAIANELVENGARVTVAAGSFQSPEQFFDPRVDILRLNPLIRKSKEGYFSFSEQGDRIPRPEYKEEAWQAERVRIVRDFIRKNPVHAVMLEYWPFSRQKVFNKSVDAVLRESHRHGLHPLVISSARDVINTKHREGKMTMDDLLAEDKAIKLIRSKVDRVLVHGDNRVIEFSEGFSRMSEIERKIVYTGFVTTNPSKNNHGREKMVLVSVGSGTCGSWILKSVFNAQAKNLVLELQDHQWVYIMGPRMPQKQREELVRLFDGYNEKSHKMGRPPIMYRDFVPNLPNLFEQADFSISMGGYNTTFEVLASGVKGVIIPKAMKNGKEKSGLRPCDEQYGRARHLEKQGLLTVLDPRRVKDTKWLGERLREAFRKERAVPLVDFNGANRTAKLVLEWIRKRYQKAPLPIAIKETGPTP